MIFRGIEEVFLNSPSLSLSYTHTESPRKPQKVSFMELLGIINNSGIFHKNERTVGSRKSERLKKFKEFTIKLSHLNF